MTSLPVVVDGPLQQNFDALSARTSKSELVVSTSLPSRPSIGQQTLFQAAEHVYWQLVYTGEATYPWAKIGGPPMVSRYTATAGPYGGTAYASAGNGLIAPLAMEADLIGRSALVQNQEAVINDMRIAVFVGGGEVVNGWASHIASGQFGGGALTAIQRVGVTKGAAIETRVASISAHVTVWYFPSIEIDPVRVG